MTEESGQRTARIDAIVPPPWSGPRRLLVAVPTLLAVVVVGALWWSGVFGPNLGPVRGFAWGAVVEPARVPDGADGLVEVELHVHNRGWLPVEIHDVWSPPFTGAYVESGDAVTIGPRHEGTVPFSFVVTDCSHLRAAGEPYLSVVASSGVATVHGRGLRVLGAHGETADWDGAPDPGTRSWWYQLAQSVCDPDGLAP